ncbi:MAG: hypothetical protein ACI9G1_002294 [Pirellulaceae bacterium]|jgi:hypothetical protein
MKKTSISLLLFVLTVSVGAIVPSRSQAGSPFSLLLPFKSVDADPQKSYVLSPKDGPWMILATSFSGADAQTRADQLVLELRKQYKMKAFTHRQSYDFTQKLEGKGMNKYGRAKTMKHKQSVKFNEVAVLVGDFDSIENSSLQSALKKLKYMLPETFSKPKVNGDVGFGQLRQIRELHRAVSSTLRGEQKKGPMGSAFATRNPLIPKEFFAPSGLDQFVIDMNKNVTHSLLKNQGKFTVRVATFRGETTLGNTNTSFGSRNGVSKLEIAAEKAHRLTEALREQGIDAYEFHDRHESIVAVGSFASVGEPRADGKIEINPTVHRVMEAFGASRRNLSGLTGLQPRQLSGISFDVQPFPVLVPRKSIGTDYAKGNSQFR